MAEDWIKMRCDLYRDPKVIIMADSLMARDGKLAAFVSQHMQRDMTVTRNVTRNATIGGLLSVWSVARKQGKRQEDDLLLPGCSTAVLDDIADLPGFGAAMEQVGWVAETDAGLVFPRFFEENNADPLAAIKAKAAERQRRYRQKNNPPKSNVTEDVTVTSRNALEKSREDSNTPIAPNGAGEGDFSLSDGSPAPKPRAPKRLTQAQKHRTKHATLTETMQRIGSWFGRQPTTLWSVAEYEALETVSPTEKELAGMEAYYSASILEGEDYRRRDVITLLNNWPGELDRARAHYRKTHSAA